MSLQPVKGPKRAEQSRLMAVKRTEKLSGLLIYQYSYLSDCAFKKSNRLNRQNNTLTLFCAFLCRHCTTMTGKYLISRFMEHVNKRRLNFVSLSELEFSS